MSKQVRQTHRKSPDGDSPTRRISFACLACRVSFKKPSVDRTADPETARFPCPNCRKPMQYMGRTFHAPRRNATRQWRKVALLIEHGYRFESMGYDPLPKSLNELEEMLRNERPSPFNMVRGKRMKLAAAERSARVGGTEKAPHRKWWRCRCGASVSPTRATCGKCGGTR